MADWEKTVAQAEQRAGRKLSVQELKPIRELYDRKGSAYQQGLGWAGATMILTAPVLGPAAVVAGLVVGKMAHRITMAKREDRMKTAFKTVAGVAVGAAIADFGHIKVPD